MTKSEHHKAVNFIENVLTFGVIFVPIVGSSCAILFDYKTGVEIFNVGLMFVPAYWTFKFAMWAIDRWF